MTSPEGASPSSLRVWLAPLLTLLVFAGCLLLSVGFLDWGRPLGALAVLWSPDPSAAAAALGSAGEIVAGVLAIAITVVAIVVELAATRYTHRITQLFVWDSRNILVTGFFVVTAVQVVASSLLLGPGSMPLWTIRLSVVMLLLSLLLLLPYFAFVFSFVNPLQIIVRLERGGLDQVAGRVRGRSRDQRVHALLDAIDYIADMGQNAVANRDKGVAVAAVEALGRIGEGYQGLRASLDPSWFAVDGAVARDLDFVSLAPELHRDLAEQRTWLEMKLMRRYEALFKEALGRDEDLNHLVAIRTRRIAESATDPVVHDLVVKFFNTFLRAALNGRDVRSAYNVLHQYRLLGLHCLGLSNGELTARIGEHLLYYARQAKDLELRAVVVIIAYDYAALLEGAYDKRSLATRPLLSGFLRLDQEIAGRHDDSVLRGVRKAQVRVATFFLVHRAVKAARRIYEDMADEPVERLRAIRDDLRRVERPDYWEVTDRGENHEYLTPDRKEQLEIFFSWFSGLSDKPAHVTQLLEHTLIPSDGGD